MSKSKIVLILVLCLTVITFCISAPTYSWFDRPRSGEPREAGALVLDDQTIYGYNGYNVTARTYTSDDGGDTYGTTDITNFSSGSDGLGVGYKSLYRTTLINQSDHAQNVSLYLKGLNIGFDTSSDFFVGTNSPVRSYRKYQTQVKQTYSSYDTVRVYLDPNAQNVASWKDYSTSIKIRYGTGTTSSPNWVKVGGEEMSRVSPTDTSINKRYFDLPLNATVVQFFANNDSSGSNATPYMSLSGYCPNLSAKYSYYFGVDAAVDGTYSNHNCACGQAQQPLLMSYFDNILLGKSDDDTFSFSFKKDVDYTGASITASSSDIAKFTVTQTTNSDTGITTFTLQGKDVGEATLNLAIVGEMYGETRNYQIPVTITQEGTTTINEITIAKNILLQPKDDPNHLDVVNVDWYIKNDITGSGPLKFTIDGLYIGG